MCLGLPALIVSLDEECPLRMGQVMVGRVKQDVSLLLVPESRCGDFVLVHAGMAITMVNSDNFGANNTPLHHPSNGGSLDLEHPLP